MLLVDVKAPEELYQVLRDNELIALPKKDDYIRPVGMGLVIRKLVSILFLFHTFEKPAVVEDSTRKLGESFNDLHFKGLQYGCTERGTEKIIHFTRQSLELHPDRDHFFMDEENAFNQVSRWKALARIKEHFPFIIPFLSKIYGEDSNGWFFGHNCEEARTTTGIPSLEGVHQGDVFGSWIHCMATLPFVQELANLVGEDGSSKFFIDDGNLSASFTKMAEAFDYVFDEGPKVGYHLKRIKGVYLLGRCEDRAEAVRRKLALIARFHFDPAMIRIHPDNGGDKLLYGAKVLGSYLGSKESIANRLEKKLAELKKEADAITMVGSLQIQYLLLRWCFCQKIIHLQRTIPPNLIGTYLEPGFTELKKLILNSILGRADGIPPKTFALAELHIHDSGLGLFHSADTSKAAFLAS